MSEKPAPGDAPLDSTSRSLDIPNEPTLEELHHVVGQPRIVQKGDQAYAEVKSIFETKTNDNQHMLLTHVEKSRIAQHLQVC